MCHNGIQNQLTLSQIWREKNYISTRKTKRLLYGLLVTSNFNDTTIGALGESSIASSLYTGYTTFLWPFQDEQFTFLDWSNLTRITSWDLPCSLDHKALFKYLKIFFHSDSVKSTKETAPPPTKRKEIEEEPIYDDLSASVSKKPKG